MDKQRELFRVKNMLLLVCTWEVVFWGLLVVLCHAFGYFDPVSDALKLDFKHESALYLLFLLPVIGLLFGRYIVQKNKLISTIANPSVRQRIFPPVNQRATFLKFFFFRNAIVGVIFAIAQPVFGTQKVSGYKENTELLITVDISSSMNAKDLDRALSRLQIAKRAMIQLINNLHGEKLGIVVFAGQAYAHLPLTLDYDAAKMYVNEIETTMITDQGTNIPNGLQSSQLMFSKSRANRLLILLTDAENHELGIDEAMSSLAGNKVRVAVLGIGTRNGGLIPNHPKKPQLGYKINTQGKRIVSKMNADLVKEIALQSTGVFATTTNAFPDLNRLLLRLKKHNLETKSSVAELDVQQNRYQIPLFFAIVNWILFTIWSASGSNRWRFFQKNR